MAVIEGSPQFSESSHHMPSPKDAAKSIEGHLAEKEPGWVQLDDATLRGAVHPLADSGLLKKAARVLVEAGTHRVNPPGTMNPNSICRKPGEKQITGDDPSDEQASS